MRTEAEIQRDELQALAHERLGLIADLEAQVRDLQAAVAQAQASTRTYRKRAQRARRQHDELRAQLGAEENAATFWKQAALADVDDTAALMHARWHRALDNPGGEPAGPIRDHIEQHDQAVRAAAVAELHEQLRAAIADASVYSAEIVGLLKAAEVIGVPDAEEVEHA